jgi:hypothetical protein
MANQFVAVAITFVMVIVAIMSVMVIVAIMSVVVIVVIIAHFHHCFKFRCANHTVAVLVKHVEH